MTVETAAPHTAAAPAFDRRPGLLVVLAALAIYGGLALTVDFPRAAMGIHSDEATYYMLGYSLAKEGDLAYRHEDLERVWREFPSGPAGVFLKKGRDILQWGLMLRPPFFWTRTQADPDQTRYFYGKSFIYPLAAAPFIRLFGTNGFLVLHALLLALVLWCSYLFLHARMPSVLAAALAAAFVMVTVVPVYFVWISPELFNFALGLFAYFCWLYKEVAPPQHRERGPRWLFGPSSDLVAGLLIGVAAFSKVSNILLLLPIVAWHIWQRRWTRMVATGAVCGICAAALFGVNLAATGDWNYQGCPEEGGRRLFMWEFPFQSSPRFDIPGTTVTCRTDAQTDVSLDSRLFWPNFSHNLLYSFVGRNAGLVPYFFPAAFAIAAFLMAPRRRPGWQWLVLAASLFQIVFFIINLPYTWSGSGGSVGNRYFMGIYGAFLFVIPPLTRTWTAAIPWAIGALFTAPLVLNPFVTSFQPSKFAMHGPLRLLPVELTLLNDIPLMTEQSTKKLWLGGSDQPDDPGFQAYFLDDNAFGLDTDKSFWTRGEGNAEFLIKSTFPAKRLVLMLTAGPVPVRVKAKIAGRSQDVSLSEGETQQITFNMPPGFWYEARAFVWDASISTDRGFVPLFFDQSSKDSRYLGVRVRPRLVPPGDGH